MGKLPVLFLIFNRPETTRRVFDAIRAYRPEKLFIAADGPRPDRAGEAEMCRLAREEARKYDWPCEVKTRFLDANLGCRDAVSSAVTWYFSQVDEGVILEDDCLPCPDFFRFAETMLEHFRDDEKVMHISGVNFQGGVRRGESDGFFSTIPHIWGWASWKRAWQHYDVEMKDYPQVRASGELAANLPGTRYLKWVLLRMMEQTYRKSPYFNTWDVQWHYALAKCGALAVAPNVNLVSNIGGSSTHQVESSVCGLLHGKLPDEITPPKPPETADVAADMCTLNKIYAGNWRSKIRYLWERMFSPGRCRCPGPAMIRFLKIILTGALALIQLAAFMIPLFGLTYFIREFGGDNDDGMFTPTAVRRWKAVLVSAACFAIWAGQFYAMIRALFKMWGKRPVTTSFERKD